MKLPKHRRMNLLWLHDLVLEAAETEKRMPSPRLRKYTSTWPEFKSEWLAYASAVTQVKLDKATNKQIDSYDWLTPKMLALETNDRSLIWMVAHSAAFRSRGPAWSKVAKQRNSERRKVKDDYVKALVKLLQICKQDKKNESFFHW